MTITPKFIKKLLPGDIVLADRGVGIDDVIAMDGAKLLTSAFAIRKKQLIGKEVEH